MPYRAALQRALPLRAYFLMLLGVFAAVAVASLLYIHVQTQNDAEDAAHKHARFAARAAALDLSNQIVQLRTQIVGLAAAPNLDQAFVHPDACTLQATGGHIDVIDTEGRSRCSSLKITGKRSYAETRWFAMALRHPVLLAPVMDEATGKWSVVSAAPLPGGKGVAAGIFNLESIGPDLGRKYSGGEPFVFTVTDSKRVLIRSIKPREFIGDPVIRKKPLRGEFTAKDRQGVERFFYSTVVPGVGWRFLAGEKHSAAVAPARRLERREFGLVLAGLLLMFVATTLAYWAIAAPIARLRRAVQQGEVVPAEGPSEVKALGRDIEQMVERQARERQQEKMAALGQLASGVAHDFNNVLLVIRTHAERLLRRPQSDVAVREGVSQIDKAAERGAELAHQLLAFSRQRALAPTPTDVNEVVLETTGLIERVIGANIRVRTGLAERLPMVLIDRGQLSQVVLNLAINARDAMTAGGVLTIRTNGEGDHVMIEVTDTGIGMSERTRLRVFDPFFTTKGNGGTGLGLATVKGIIEGVGGVIDVESRLAHGTTFRVHLPAADEAAIEAILPPVEALGGDETILLVEDEDVLRPLIADTLRYFGYTVIEARDGQEALAAARSESIALVMADVILPGVQGDGVVDKLLEAQPGLGVLFTSGIPRDEQVHPLVPVEHFIAKPYTPDELARKVREVLDS